MQTISIDVVSRFYGAELIVCHAGGYANFVVFVTANFLLNSFGFLIGAAIALSKAASELKKSRENKKGERQ